MFYRYVCDAHYQKNMLPVVIAGAGPCGLVAALTLEKAGVPYVFYEKTAPRSSVPMQVVVLIWLLQVRIKVNIICA